MPTFYSHATSRRLPTTPPEYFLGYNVGGYGHYSQPKDYPHFSTEYGLKKDEPAEYYGCYGYGSGYEIGKPGFNGSGHFAAPPRFDLLFDNRQYHSMEVPAMHQQMKDLSVGDHFISHYGVQEQIMNNEVQKEDKPIGGVSAKLDYDMERMTDFVCEVSQGMYAILQSPICFADVDIVRSIQPGCPVQATFRKWVSQVLCSTRLPSATIILSLHYLSIRMSKLANGAGSYKGTDGQIYRLLTIALLLGSKFLDDNTFINRSWSEVSGIKVAELNRLETEWLISIKFDLHLDPLEAQGFATWQAHWQRYCTHAATSVPSIAKVADLMPLDTRTANQSNISHQPISAPVYPQMYQSSSMLAFSADPRHSRYKPASFSHYDGWNGPRSASDASPTSAPHSGPTTPDYFIGSSVWNQGNVFSQNSAPGFYGSQQPQSQCNFMPHPTLPTALPRQSTFGLGTFCDNVNYRPGVTPYLFNHGSRQQAVSS